MHVCATLVVSFFGPVEGARLPTRPVLGVVGACFCRRTDWLRSDLVFLVYDLDLDVFAVFIGRGHVWSFLFKFGPWSLVRVCPIHD